MFVRLGGQQGEQNIIEMALCPESVAIWLQISDRTTINVTNWRG
jgi:hypothetical protein